MTKEILRLAESIFIDRVDLINKAIHDDVKFYVSIDEIIKADAELSIKAAELFYQVKGEIETGVVK